MTYDPTTGVWSAWGREAWINRSYYAYEVAVFVRSLGVVATNLVADPYALGAAPGNARSLVVDLREFATFEDAAKVKIKFTSDRDLDTTGFGVTPGKAETKNMLRVFYKWPVITDFLRTSMSNLKGNKTLHFATTTWQNEPFND